MSDWVKTWGTGSTTAAITSPHKSLSRPETQAEKVARLEAENAHLRADKATIETEKSNHREAVKSVVGETSW